MIVLIDNYDSFSYNVYQLIGSVKPDIKVVRNDEVTIKELEAMKPEALILSPGPGKPEDAGICIESIKYFKDKLPILGICLGHQSICEAFGGTVSYAKELMHGKQKEIHKVGKSRMFEGLPETFPAAWCRGGTGVRFLYGRVRMVKKALSALQAVLGVSRSFKSWNLKFLHMEQMVSIHETLGSIA